MLENVKTTVNCKWESTVNKQDKLKILTFRVTRD